MATDYVKRMVTKDGMYRVTIFRDEYADNPRFTTDEPMHCEDWDGKCSIMQERETRGRSERELLEYLLKQYGNYDKIIGMLAQEGTHMTDGKSTMDNALVYERPMRRWVLKEYTKWYSEEEYTWKDSAYFDGRKDEIDLFELLECVANSTIDTLIENGCLTDKVKIMSYSFGYYGGISFDKSFIPNSDGIAWLEKDEFLKYSGDGEDYWKNNDCYTICKWLVDEIESWTHGEVYGYVVEKAVTYKVHKECMTETRDVEDYELTEWEFVDSIAGFYGNAKYAIDDACEFAEFNIDDLVEWI